MNFLKFLSHFSLQDLHPIIIFTENKCLKYLDDYLINIICNEGCLLPRPLITIVMHDFDPAIAIHGKTIIKTKQIKAKVLLKTITLNTHVSEKDFFVFLCSLETAILPANCITSSKNQTHQNPETKLNTKQNQKLAIN